MENREKVQLNLGAPVRAELAAKHIFIFNNITNYLGTFYEKKNTN
jgi:hypothetical protein